MLILHDKNPMLFDQILSALYNSRIHFLCLDKLMLSTEFNQHPKKSRWPLIVTALILLNILLAITLLYVIFTPLYRDTYNQATQLVKQDKTLQDRLGTPIQILLFSEADVKFKTINEEKRAFYKFTAKGPKDKAEVHVETTKEKEKWKIDDIVAYMPDLSNARSFIIIKFDTNKTKEAMEREVKNYIQDSKHVNYSYQIAQSYAYEEDYEKSAYWFQKAADEGSAYAKNDLANAYLVGRGVDKNIEKALVLYQQAAAEGDEYAMFNLGSYYFKGAEKPNYVLAAEWYKKSIAIEPHACSLNDLAILFATGKGVEKNTEESKKLFKEAGRLLLETEGELDKEALQYWVPHFIKQSKEQILTAFVEYQYNKFTSDYTKGFEEKYPTDIVQIVKTLSEKLDNLC